MANEWTLPIIHLERCTACEQCVSACPTHAVEMQGVQPVIVRPEDCAYCGLCEEMCPAGAIALPYEIGFFSDEGDNDVKTDRAH
jgi:NAD-dependent dihydropyrimidine dehydrogenase PreA subunit